MFPHSSSPFGLQPSPRPGLSRVPSGVFSRDPSSDSWVREFPGWDRSLLAPDFSWNFPFPGRRVRSRSFLLELGITGPSLGSCLDFWLFRVLVTRRVGHPLYRCPRTLHPGQSLLSHSALTLRRWLCCKALSSLPRQGKSLSVKPLSIAVNARSSPLSLLSALMLLSSPAEFGGPLLQPADVCPTHSMVRCSLSFRALGPVDLHLRKGSLPQGWSKQTCD